MTEAFAELALTRRSLEAQLPELVKDRRVFLLVTAYEEIGPGAREFVFCWVPPKDHVPIVGTPEACQFTIPTLKGRIY